MSKEEIIQRLRALRDSFEPDECLEFADAALEEIDYILATEAQS